MDIAVVGAVLLSALMHASWNAFVKVGGDRWLVPGVIFGTSGVAGAIGACFAPLPLPHHWPWLIGSGLLHASYLATLAHAFSHGDFGRVYPIARGTAPLLVFAASAPLLGEPVGPATALCIAALAVGIVSFAWQRPAPGTEPARGHAALGFALATGVLIAAYSLVDAAGIRAVGADIAPALPTYLSWIMLCGAIPFTTAVLVLRRGAVLPFPRQSGLKGACGGLGAMASYAPSSSGPSRAPRPRPSRRCARPAWCSAR